ncbi:MAG: hypothetical protein IID36_09635, partial [Planctomycetes bacterium]|nr:hypothetical protein [Planctomycetota bacterium]
KAVDVAAQLEEILTAIQESRGITGAENKIQIVPNSGNNTIMVIAQESDRETIESLIKEIDVEPVADWGSLKLTLFPLLHSKANEMADVIKELLETDTGQDSAEEAIRRLLISKASVTGEITELPPINLEVPSRIIAHPGTNSLIVATSEENVRPLGELIRLMDGVPMADEVGVRIFPLSFADAESVRDTLQAMFDGGKDLPDDPDGSGADAVPEGDVGRALSYNVGIEADPRTNVLIVTGRPEQLMFAEMIISELDQPSTGIKFPLRLIPLQYANVINVGKIVGDLIEKRIEALEAIDTNKAALERERIFFTIDLRSNSLIVSASDENFEELVELVRQLDTKPAQVFDLIRLVPCDRLAAANIKDKIDELWQRKADLRSEVELPTDTPVIAVDERSNTLVIASSLEDYDEIKELVAQLESRPMIDDIQLYKLMHADAGVLQVMLDELFQGVQSASEAFTPPTIIADKRANTLIIAGPRDALEKAADIVARLDVKAGPMTAMLEVYSLTYASAVTLAERMNTLFEARQQDEGEGATPVVIMPDESSNSLICSASKDHHSVIIDLLGLLDRPSNIAHQFQIFPLRYARAAQVAERLDQLFQASGDTGGGRPDAIATEADERTNSILVWASPTQMDNIREIIGKLDSATPIRENTVRMFQLKRALAEDLVTLLQETVFGDGGDDEQAIILAFTETLKDGTKVQRKLLRQDVSINADPRTNSLLVSAPTESIDLIETMVREFDSIRPVASEVRLFALQNSDAETMVDKLTLIFNPDTAEGETQSQLFFGEDGLGGVELARVGQELRFAADPRTNTLIAAGAEIDLDMVEQLVAHLDALEVEERRVEVYQAKYRDAQDLASAVQNFIQQEQDVLSEATDEASMMLRAEQQVSIEAIGDPDEGSSSLIVGTSRRAYHRTMDMIHQLDRPEPQVMISVLIAEVTLSDSVELGVEIAGQDLHFSENAVLGPNGIIQGSMFDYVLGTDLGAAGLGLGGLNFTVTGEDFSLLLHALQQESVLEVLSRPVLMIRNGEEGEIRIADSVPFVSSSGVSDSGQINSTVAYEDVGVVLTATPHISPDGYVTIELVQEVSNFAGENIQLTEGLSSPIFQNRIVDTNVTVRDGETVVIGGLITTRESTAVSKVPFFGDIPVLGRLFRTDSVSTSKTELLIVLTVDVLRTDEDVRQMSIEQRDKFVLPDSIRTSPLMEGLRIIPSEAGMGPKTPEGDEPPTRRIKHDREQYGPKPKTYGPIISRPSVTTTASAAVYGPKVVRAGDVGAD